MGVLIMLSVAGAALNVVPFFFYDLTEIKQKSIIKILQIRAMFEEGKKMAAVYGSENSKNITAFRECFEDLTQNQNTELL